jgi:hypothetical protein
MLDRERPALSFLDREKRVERSASALGFSFSRRQSVLAETADTMPTDRRRCPGDRWFANRA